MSSVTNITEEDWKNIKWEFENIKCTLDVLAEKYSVYKMKISRMSKKEGWVKYVSPTDNHNYNAVTAVNPGGILNTVGIRKIQEIVLELGEFYSPVDEPLVVSYAESYQRYLKLVVIVDERGEVCVSPKTGGEYMSPYFSALQSVKADMAKLGDRLGLSIASRKRLNLNLTREDKTKSLFDLVADISEEDMDI